MAATLAAGLTGCSTHPAGTEVINVVAVDAAGQPTNGYHENTGGQPAPGDCTDPSPAAVSGGIYRCWPAADGADVCWPAAGLDLLCLNDPWSQELHRIRANAALPTVSAPAHPTPVALELDDGAHCRLRNGGAWGHRADDLVAYYGCAGGDNLTVLAPTESDPIDRSAAVWTVKVGPDQAPESAPPPVSRQVRTAWFAGN